MGGENVTEVFAFGNDLPALAGQKGSGPALIFSNHIAGQFVLSPGNHVIALHQHAVQGHAPAAVHGFGFHGDLRIAVRGGGQHHFPTGNHVAVLLNFQNKTVFVQVGEIQTVINPQCAVFIGGADGLVSCLCLQSTGLEAAVRKYQTVAAEVAVIGLFSGEVAAVALDPLFVHDHMVGPFPDAAADELGILVEQFVVGIHITGAVAHGMGVFAEENRLTDGFVQSFLFQLLHAGVHMGHQVGEGLGGDPEGILAVDQTGSIPSVDPGRHSLVAGIKLPGAGGSPQAAFVAQGPHDDRRAVLVIFQGALHPLQVFPAPFGPGGRPATAIGIRVQVLIGIPGAEAVGLHVVFQYHIEAQLVAQLGKPGVRGIVGGADTVHVQLLHQLQVPPQFLLGLAPAPEFAGVVVIHTVQFDADTVDQQFIPVGNGNGTQTGMEGQNFSIPLQLHPVEERLLRIPEHRLFGSVGKGIGEILFTQKCFSGIDPGFGGAVDLQGDGLVIGDHFHVRDVALRPLQDVHIPENAVHPEKVLVLQIAAAAPFQHLDPDGVGAGMDVGGDVEFSRQMAALGEAYLLSVDIQEGTGGHTFKDEVDLAPDFFQLKLALVNTAGVVIGHIGDVHGIRVIDIGIVGILIAVELPAGGHGNGIPDGDLLGNIDIPVKKCKVPGTVQRKMFAAAAGDIVASGRESILAGFFGVFVNTHLRSLLPESIVREEPGFVKEEKQIRTRKFRVRKFGYLSKRGLIF